MFAVVMLRHLRIFTDHDTSVFMMLSQHTLEQSEGNASALDKEPEGVILNQSHIFRWDFIY